MENISRSNNCYQLLLACWICPLSCTFYSIFLYPPLILLLCLSCPFLSSIVPFLLPRAPSFPSPYPNRGHRQSNKRPHSQQLECVCVCVCVCVSEAPSQQKTRMTLWVPDRNVTEKKKKKERRERWRNKERERKGRQMGGREQGREEGHDEREKEEEEEKKKTLGTQNDTCSITHRPHTHTHVDAQRHTQTVWIFLLCTNRHARTPRDKHSHFLLHPHQQRFLP